MTRIEGTDIEALSRREGRFWEVMSGRRPQLPIAQLLGRALRWVDPDEGAISAEFSGNPELTNPFGVINGGILATMLDITMGTTLAGRM